MATLPPPAGERKRRSAGSSSTAARSSRATRFWGLAGTRQDGGSFAEDAYARRASGVVVGRPLRSAGSGDCWSLRGRRRGRPR